MSGKEHWSYYLIIASLVGCVTLADIPELKKQPFGLTMCKNLCQRVSGCHDLKYIHSNLSCQIGDIQYQAANGKQRIGIFNISKAKNTTMKCFSGDILIKSRAEIFHCVRCSPRTGEANLNMTLIIHETCQKLYHLCSSGNTLEAKTQLLKLCAESTDATPKHLSKMDAFVVKNGCDLSRLVGGNMTILHRASKLGLLDVVKCVLSKQQVSIESRNIYGRTPIMRAAERARADVFRLLLNVGSNLSKVDNYGYSILHFACRGGSLTIVKDILTAGSGNMHCRTKEGFTPIMTAVQYCQNAVFKYLLEKGSDVSEVTNTGSNVLHIATSSCKENLVKYILDDKIADIDSRDYRGRTPIMMAAKNYRRKTFRFLLRRKANLQIKDIEGNTLLHIACIGGDATITEIVLKYMKKDAVRKKNKQGKSPWDFAKKKKSNQKLLSVLKSHPLRPFRYET